MESFTNFTFLRLSKDSSKPLRAITNKQRKHGRTLPGVASLPKLLQECINNPSKVTKEPRTTSKEFQASLASVFSGQYSQLNNKKVTGQKWHRWTSYKVKPLLAFHQDKRGSAGAGSDSAALSDLHI